MKINKVYVKHNRNKGNFIVRDEKLPDLADRLSILLAVVSETAGIGSVFVPTVSCGCSLLHCMLLKICTRMLSSKIIRFFHRSLIDFPSSVTM